jgi:hypothetical protein
MAREAFMTVRKVRKPKTHYVPKIVYQTAFVGVVPLCVAGLACGSSSSAPDAGPLLTVACSGFCGVGVAAFTDAGDAGMDAADSPADAAPDGSCFCCTNFCGVGVAAFADSGDEG